MSRSDGRERPIAPDAGTQTALEKRMENACHIIAPLLFSIHFLFRTYFSLSLSSLVPQLLHHSLHNLTSTLRGPSPSHSAGIINGLIEVAIFCRGITMAMSSISDSCLLLLVLLHLPLGCFQKNIPVLRPDSHLQCSDLVQKKTVRLM